MTYKPFTIILLLAIIVTTNACNDDSEVVTPPTTFVETTFKSVQVISKNYSSVKLEAIIEKDETTIITEPVFSIFDESGKVVQDLLTIGRPYSITVDTISETEIRYEQTIGGLYKNQEYFFSAHIKSNGNALVSDEYSVETSDKNCGTAMMSLINLQTIFLNRTDVSCVQMEDGRPVPFTDYVDIEVSGGVQVMNTADDVSNPYASEDKGYKNSFKKVKINQSNPMTIENIDFSTGDYDLNIYARYNGAYINNSGDTTDAGYQVVLKIGNTEQILKTVQVSDISSNDDLLAAVNNNIYNDNFRRITTSFTLTSSDITMPIAIIIKGIGIDYIDFGAIEFY